jgi:O-methyltransferase domain
MTVKRSSIASVLRLVELADYIIPHTIRAVAELRVADQLADGPKPVAEIAAAVGAHPPSLTRALRALACKGMFTEVEPEVFGLTPMAQLLRTDHPQSLHGCFPVMPGDLEAWSHIDYSVSTGLPAFPYVHGKSYYDYIAERPGDSARFDYSQQAPSRMELRAALRGLDWSALGRVVDVGGGNGAFLAGVLARHRGLRGVVFDLPHAVATAPDVLAEAGVADRCEVVGGSFFDTVPAGGDTYLLKRTLYNWDDDSARRILAGVRAAMGGQSRLLIFEPVRQPGAGFDVATLTDLLMLVFTGGRLRTPDEIGQLLADAGLHLVAVHPTAMFPIIEARANSENPGKER